VADVEPPLLATNEKSIPVAKRGTVCGMLEAVPDMRTTALRGPVAVGMNFTLIVQLSPAATVAGQLFVSAKSTALLPVMAMLVIFRGAAAEFVTVMPCAVLMVPTIWPEKLRALGARLVGIGASLNTVPTLSEPPNDVVPYRLPPLSIIRP